MSGSSTAFIIVGVLGIALIVFSSARLGKARNLKGSVLRKTDYTPAQIRAVQMAVLERGTLPEDSTLHALTIDWAREEALLAPRALKWQPFQFVGVILALTGLYLVPGLLVVVVVVVVQALLLILGVGAFQSTRKGITRARELSSRWDRTGGET